MLLKKQSGFFLAVAGFIFCLASMAAAEAPICFIKGVNTAAPTGAPCSDGKSAYDNAKTLIKYEDGCSAPKAMDIIFQQESGSASAVGGYQASMAYDPAQMSDPTCTLDPEGFFSDTAGLECPGTYQGTTTYIFGGEANISNDLWPASNPNFILMGISFGTFSIAEGATGTVTNFTTSAAKQPKVLDPGGDELQTGLVDADVICTAPPVQVNAASNGSYSKQNIACTGDPLTGTLDVTLGFSIPSMTGGCKKLDDNTTVNCGDAPPAGGGCTSLSATVTRTGANLGTVSCSGTSCNVTDTGFAVDTTSKSATYSIVATCEGGGAVAVDSTSYSYEATGLSCGDPPVVSNVQINSVAVPTDNSVDKGDGYQIFENSPITITGTVTDPDTTVTSVNVILYYAQSGADSFTAVTAVNPDSSGNFTVTIPSTSVSSENSLVFGFTYSDGDFTEKYPTTLDVSDPSSGSIYIDKEAIARGTALDFVQGKTPYPNQMPFRAGGNQRLVIGFKVNEIASVTMRLYTPQGTLIRQIEDSTSDPESANNVCNWEKGCSWDGTTYKGTQLASNGLYIVNIYAVGTGQNFGNQTINYTKGIVVMK